MHFYKRDLTPVKEGFTHGGTQITKASPYKQNFSNSFQVNLSTSDFRKTLLKGMGDSVKCVTSTCPNQV